MALAIVATSGSATANSFATVAEADTYLEARLNASAWNDEDDDDQKIIALIEATRALNTLPWSAQRTSSTQALAWPQRYCLDPDAPAITGISDIAQLYFDDTEIPTRVKYAEIELALEFLRAGTTDIAAADSTAGVIEETVGPLTTKWSAYARPQGLALYPRVIAYVAPLLATSAGSLEVARS